MDTMTIALGTVVRDRYGHTGIVCSKETTPSKEWIDEQLNSEELKKLGVMDWWGIQPFSGGYLLAAGPLLEYLREATYEDFLSAVETARQNGRERLANIFPKYVDRLLSERK